MSTIYHESHIYSISTNLLGRSVANQTVDSIKAMSRVAGYLVGSRKLVIFDRYVRR